MATSLDISLDIPPDNSCAFAASSNTPALYSGVRTVLSRCAQRTG